MSHFRGFGEAMQVRSAATLSSAALFGDRLAFSTFLGGARTEAITAVAADTQGNIYVTGWTESSDWPTRNAAQRTFGGSVDAFVAKLDPVGAVIVYATYLGGSGDDRGLSIAVDATGNVYVTWVCGLHSAPTEISTY